MNLLIKHFSPVTHYCQAPMELNMIKDEKVFARNRIAKVWRELLCGWRKRTLSQVLGC